MPNKYNDWINANKESLIDQWETGFTVCGDIIEQATYEDFVLHMWAIESKPKRPCFVLKRQQCQS